MRLALIAACLGFACVQPVRCLDFKIGVIVEDGASVTAELIHNTVRRIVNDDWMYFSTKSNHRMVYEFQAVPLGKSVSAVQKACNWQNVSALVGVGGCNLVKCVRDLGHSIGVPTVVVPVGLCDVTPDSDLVVVGRELLSQQIAAALSAIEFEKAKEVSVLYDEVQDFQLVQDFLNRLTAKGVATNTFLITDGNAIGAVRSAVSANARLIVVLASAGGIRDVLLAANSIGATRVDFHWLTLDPGLSSAQLTSWLPTSGPANLLMVRSTTQGLLSASTCPDRLVAILGPSCRPELVTPTQLQTVEAILALATSMAKLNASDPGSASVASCRASGVWKSGIVVAAQLKRINSTGFILDNISFDSTSHLSSRYVELISTSSSLFSDRVRFVEAARFEASTQKLAVSFTYKKTKLVFANKFLDFKGATLTVCSPAITPYTVYTNVSNGYDGKIIEGYNADVLSVLESALNFRSLVRPPASGNQSGCISEVVSGKSDIAMLFGLNTATYTSVDFSTDILPLSHTLLVKRPVKASDVWNVFAPFTYDVWLLLIAMFIVVPMLLYLVAYYSPFSAWNLGLSYAIADEIWFKEYVWSLVGSFLQQGQDFFPFAASPRTILAFWWLFTVVIFGTYTGELAAQLTINVQHRPLKSLSELASDPMYVVHVTRGSSIHNSILHAASGDLKSLRSKLRVVESETACADVVLNTPYTYQVCIMDQNLNFYYANNFCYQCYVISEYFNPSFNGLAFPKNAYYVTAFNRILQKSKETGMTNLIRQRYFPTKNPECEVPEITMSTAAVNMEGIGGTCILTGSFYAIGLLLLIIELLWTDVCKKQPLDFVCF